MTDAELVILILLAEKRNHGYELESMIEQRGMREWTGIGFSSIYFLLKKLEREGLVDSALTPGERGAARRVYALTAAGRRTWQVACLAALANPAHSWAGLQLALSALPALPALQARQALQHYHASQVARLARIESKRQAQQPLPPHVNALFDHSRALLTAEIAWLEGFLNTLGRKGSNGKDRLQEAG